MVAALMLASAGVGSTEMAWGATGLHDCGTRIDATSATGWCRGTGTFSMDVTCADGSIEHAGTVYIREGYGTVGASCFNHPRAAHIVVKS